MPRSPGRDGSRAYPANRAGGQRLTANSDDSAYSRRDEWTMRAVPLCAAAVAARAVSTETAGAAAVPAAVPEVPYAVLLPVAALVIGGLILWRRRQG